MAAPIHALTASLLLLGACSSPAGDPDAARTDLPAAAADAAPPACSKHVQHENLIAVTSGALWNPSPAVGLGPDEVLGLWLAKGELRLGRWGLDGVALGQPLVIATQVTLPGGDAGLRALAVGYADGTYLAAWEEASTRDVFLRRMDASGAGQPPQKLNPETRGGGLAIEASSPRIRVRDSGFVVLWSEGIKGSDNKGAAAQAFDAAGKPLLGATGAYIYGRSSASVDAYVAPGRLKAARYKQGQGSVADKLAVLSQTSLNNLKTWADATLALPQPAGVEVSRWSPSLLPLGSGSVFTDRASISGGEERIEIAWLDGNGSVQKTRSIDLAPAIRFTSEIQAHVADKDLLVAWADASDAIGFGAMLHVRRFAAAGQLRSVDVTLSLQSQGKGGYLHGLAPIVPAPGGARTAFVWRSGDIWFVGAQLVCLASSP